MKIKKELVVVAFSRKFLLHLKKYGLKSFYKMKFKLTFALPV